MLLLLMLLEVEVVSISTQFSQQRVRKTLSTRDYDIRPFKNCVVTVSLCFIYYMYCDTCRNLSVYFLFLITSSFVLCVLASVKSSSVE